MLARIKKLPFLIILVSLVAALGIAYAAYLAVAFAGQAPLDLGAFRQAQTALTSFWFIQEGFKLAYETPVVGPPFAIPFEFPLYQAMVAFIAKISGLPLIAVGRVTSFVFLLLCIIPARSITRSLQLPQSVFLFFVALVFTAPLYVYWGRTFMIETAALFFTFAAIACFVEYLFASGSGRSLLLFAVFATLAVLQKATTWLPAVPVLGLTYLVVEGRSKGWGRDLVLGRRALRVAASFLVPILIGWLWVRYTDNVKMLNPLGKQLTSEALSWWNWGSLAQRMSPDIWTMVVWKRLVVENMGAVIGLYLLASPFLVRTEARVRWTAFAAIALGIMPLYLFTNLHLVHTYYQTANAIFLFFALAVALGAVIVPRIGAASALLMFGAIVLGNHRLLTSDGYMAFIKQRFTEENRDVAVGTILQREVPRDKVFVAFGMDWSSTLAYMAQRKSFTAPGWFKDYAQLAKAPERYAGGRLGAVVACPSALAAFPTVGDVARWSEQGRSWKLGEVQGCVIAVPQKAMETPVSGNIQCLGNIDAAQVYVRDGQKMLSVAGWVASAGSPSTLPELVFISVAAPGVPAKYYDTFKVSRPDVNEYLKVSEDTYVGFTRLVPGDWKPGEYVVGVVQYAAGRYQACQLKKQIVVP